MNTIGIDTGDTDHYWIGDADNVSIRLNFPYMLRAPRFFFSNNRKLVHEASADVSREKDGSSTYSTKISNGKVYEGAIFYFEGKKNEKPVKKKGFLEPPISIEAKNGTKYLVQKCQAADIREIYRIETEIESGNSATEATLFERLNLFDDGFLVIKTIDGIVCGYLESVIWQDFEFQSFDEIKDFPLHFDPSGDTLYIIFLAIDPKYRDLHLGIQLINTALACARHYGLDKVKLVAKDSRIGLYQKCGFVWNKQLPHFLENTEARANILMIKDLA